MSQGDTEQDNWRRMDTERKRLLLTELRSRNARAYIDLRTPNKLWRFPYKFYGVNKQFRDCTDPTIVLSGPAETGKTITTLSLIHELAVTNPNLRVVIVRKSRSSMDGTVLRSWIDKILPEDRRCVYNGATVMVAVYGGEKPQLFNYSNGSKIYVTGIDNGSKILSGEFDIIYVNQAEELNMDDIESLETRVTGRAGNIKTRPPQLIMDCNPGGSKHPIKLKEAAKALTLFNSRHEDNPTLFDQETGIMTAQGDLSLSRLDRLTGVRYLRLRKGIWAGAEGLYFMYFDPVVHGVATPFTAESVKALRASGWDIWASMDYGFNHWNVIYLHAQDTDGNIYTFDEIAHRQGYPADIADDLTVILRDRYEITAEDLDGFFVSPDAFINTGRAKTTIAEQYGEKGIYMTSALSGPGSRVAKAHLLQSLLGNPEIDPPIAPRWFYVRSRCPMLEECIPQLIASPTNSEDVKKWDANEKGDGGDDAYDALMMGLYKPGGASFG